MNVNKNIIFGIAVIFIIGIIWFIEMSKPSIPNGTGVSIALSPDEFVPATTTASGAAQLAERIQIIKQKSSQYPPAMEIIPGGQFINSPPFKLQDIIGKKVILIDFWTYTCINCLRTIPYVEAWNNKYKDNGLVIIGVHSPEFDFEKDYNNVSDAVKRLGITYPVVQDNNYATWDAYHNRYWPRKYLIDIDGYIVYDHAGEGKYNETEAAIQKALEERAARLNAPMPATSGNAGVTPADLSAVGSPEIYFGSDRNQYLGNGNSGSSGMQEFSLPAFPALNKLYLGGTWNITSEYAESVSDSVIVFRYSSRDVYMVANVDVPAHITVFRDGKPVGNAAGADVNPLSSSAMISGHRLFRLIHDQASGEHTLEIRIDGAGLQVYTFTFG